MWYIHKVTIGKHSYCLLFTSNERSSFSCFSFISSCKHYNRASIAYVTSLRTKKVHYRDDIYSQMDVTYTQICISAISICFFLSFPIHKYIICGTPLFISSHCCSPLHLCVYMCTSKDRMCKSNDTYQQCLNFLLLVNHFFLYTQLNNRWTQHT